MKDEMIKIEVDGEVKDAEILKVVTIDGNDYAIYAIDKGDETSDILASKIVNDTLVDLETDLEKEKIKEIVDAMFS